MFTLVKIHQEDVIQSEYFLPYYVQILVPVFPRKLEIFFRVTTTL